MGQARPLAFDVGPAMAVGLLPTRARAPAKQPPTRAMPQSPRNADLQRLRAAMIEHSHPSRRSILKLQWLQSHIKARE
jgi:hypothetical protein